MIDRLLPADLWITALLAVVTIAAFLTVISSSTTAIRPPPGPTGIPYFGSLFSFGAAVKTTRLAEYVQSLHHEYGKLISIKVGALRMVFISDGPLVKRLFATDTFEDRPILRFAFSLFDGKPGGIVLNNGERHKEMRRFSLLTFRDLGVGKQTLNETIQSECAALCQYLNDSAGKTDRLISDFKTKTQLAVANVIHNIIFGFRNDYDNPEWQSLVHQIQQFFSVNPIGATENFIPFTKKLPFLNNLISGQKPQILIEANNNLKKYVMSQIEEHHTTYYEGEIRDFIDLYLKYENESKPNYDRMNIFLAILDLFRAGADTTASSLTWSVLFLIRNPEIQEELFQEMKQVIGERVFERKDSEKLIKMRAFINEVLRCASIAMFSPPHTVREDTEVNGYTLPAHCLIFLNIYALHYDREYWSDPESFRISRWIDENGQIIKHADHFLPFSTGKRVCIGKQIAQIELILFLVDLVREFRFEANDSSIMDAKPEQRPGFLRAPKDFCFKIVKRS